MPEKIPIEAIAKELNAESTFGVETFVKDVTHDSRQVTEGTLFVAIKGLTTDGHNFIDDVVRRGAAGVISEQDCPAEFTGNWLKVGNARVALAKAASVINGNPSGKLNLIGITGTNGKTTTTYLINSLVESAGEKSAMLTTVEYRIGENSVPAVRTTPEASDTQRFLREASEAGCSTAVMEASSQAIHLHRCDFLHFKIGVFTNLTRDHLDYHQTMENYYDAKKELFDGRLGTVPSAAVINVDDEWGQRLARELRNTGTRVVTFSLEAEADFYAQNINVSLLEGTSFTLRAENVSEKIISPLVGKPHVYNMLSAIVVGKELGFDMPSIKEGLATCVGAPGRFERVQTNKNFAVVVDYAHSDDALLNTLRTARGLTNGRIITVFGCGGDRDKSKRQPMGEVAGAGSDLAIITSDNPRTEDPLRIIEEIEEGIRKTSCPYLINSDRRIAIQLAISKARKNDVVVIAGKGHETYQIIGSEKFHFDDREIAREAIDALDS
ncbi:MAG: UDP-N-acetylmuramoyl-L-alanyl-D-glutamate--2,6-diaminopimelate ligase [Pyrinomonadaceae bacterium]